MTKKDQKLINKFFVNIVLNKRYKRFVNGQMFNKNSKKGRKIAVVSLQHIFKEWRKFRSQVEGK